MRYSAAFSYYGGKSKLASLYPPPRGSRIVEPFGGSAAYALRHAEGRQVWINEKDPHIFAVWRFLQSEYAAFYINALPDRIAAGEQATNLHSLAHLCVEAAYRRDPLRDDHVADLGFEVLIRGGLHPGTLGARLCDTATSMGAMAWNGQRTPDVAGTPRFKRRTRWVIDRVRGWQITNLDWVQVFQDLACSSSNAATVFVDPPYDNLAGKQYRSTLQQGDYASLGLRCRQLADLGYHVIACENAGAAWLPFVPLGESRRRGFNTVDRRTNVAEVYWQGGGPDEESGVRNPSPVGRVLDAFDRVRAQTGGIESAFGADSPAARARRRP